MQNVETPGFFFLLLNFYGYFLPLILLGIWAPLALIDLSNRSDLSAAKSVLWATVVLGLPFVGAFSYHAFAKSQLPSWVRNYLVFGGFGLLVFFFILGSFFS